MLWASEKRRGKVLLFIHRKSGPSSIHYREIVWPGVVKSPLLRKLARQIESEGANHVDRYIDIGAGVEVNTNIELGHAWHTSRL